VISDQLSALRVTKNHVLLHISRNYNVLFSIFFWRATLRETVRLTDDIICLHYFFIILYLVITLFVIFVITYILHLTPTHTVS